MTMQAAEIASLASKVIADAGRFQDVRAILDEWLTARDIFIGAGDHAWIVIIGDPRWTGKVLTRTEYPTYAQALGVALDEATKRLQEPVTDGS